MKKDKKLTNRQRIAQRRRNNKRAEKEHHRKLIRKLVHIAEQINAGHYEGVKTSPLLAVNSHRVQRYLNKGINPAALLDMSMGL